ncbi:MAG: DNA recombination protein RmuC [bacterium]|nr:DNA recombination protein RmuC [bacterium]
MLICVLILSALSAALLVWAVVLLLRARRQQVDKALLESQSALRQELLDSQAALRQELSQTVQNAVASLGNLLGAGQQRASEQMELRLKSFESGSEQKLEAIRETMERRLAQLQADNNQKLDQMRVVVDEKLQKTLETRMTQSFQLVSERLEQVYRGLGEMQSLASGVGDLKRVLSGVKTRGVLGEIQLGAILEEILSPEQYEKNVATRPRSTERVEYAVKLPGDDGHPVYLPIDSKFPGDTYQNLLEAYDSGSPDRIHAAVNALAAQIKKEARDIRDKYVSPPDTTDFAILFLPFEGLYAEVVNRGLIEELQRSYRINIAGPSTMAALLNSLQMGFRTVALQKRSSEVWRVLGAVRTEFEKFGATLERTQKRLDDAHRELDELVGTRTRQIQRKLRSVERIEDPAARSALLSLDDAPELLPDKFSE